MAQDATGTPTSLGIPKYNPAVDAPSGRGFNEAMDHLDLLLVSQQNTLGIPWVTSLPGSPSSGQKYLYQVDAANSINWLVIWNATTARWEYLGGPPLFAEVQANETTTSTTYAALGSGGPSITLPRSGEYDIAIGFSGSTSATNGDAWMSYDIGGTGAVDADGCRAESAGGNEGGSVTNMRRKAIASAATLTAKYRTSVAGTGSFSHRWMRVQPRSLS